MREIVKSYAKINLGLHVVKKMKDGYHKLDMIVSPIELHDIINFEDNDDVVVQMSEDLCEMEENLCYKIASYLKEEYNVKKGIKIYIEKNIPSGAGLGGGSSNAAEVLKFLNAYWGLKLNSLKLKKIGMMFGCDIPFFVDAHFSRVKGKGEKVKRISVGKVAERIILVVPNTKLSTKDVFCQFKDFQKNKIRKLRGALKKGDFQYFIFNDLECTANRICDGKIKEIIEKALECGVSQATMTGSGSVVVCYLKENDEVTQIEEEIKAKLSDCKIISTKMIVNSC